MEYKEYFSGQTFQAVAEAPKEALPHYCRPDFSTAWLAQSKFKVHYFLWCKRCVKMRVVRNQVDFELSAGKEFWPKLRTVNFSS